MKITKPPFDHERLERELLAFMPCQHSRPTVGQRTLTSGRDYFRLQCPDCGCPLSKQLAHARVAQLKFEGIPVEPWNEARAAHYRNERYKYSEPIYQQIGRYRRQVWWDRYSEYLDSAEWKELGARIMQRAGGVCEQCQRRRAVHVHHLTYERAGEEREEDLQAICFNCHDQAHDGMLSVHRILDELDQELVTAGQDAAGDEGTRDTITGAAVLARTRKS